MERIAIALLLLVTAVQGHSCRICDKSSCRRPTGCPGGITLDACNCCYVCARQANDSCGGMFALGGKCDVGLKCVTPIYPGRLPNYQEAGICKPVSDTTSSEESCTEVEFTGCNAIADKCECSTSQACSNPFRFPDKEFCTRHLISVGKMRERCADVQCRRHRIHCPKDSEIEARMLPDDQCCPPAGRCKCKENYCSEPICRPNQNLVLIREATGRPGSCCHQYRCVPNCDLVTCPTVQRSMTCPEDSMLVTDKMTRNGCCPLQKKCRCSFVCTETSCPEGSEALVEAKGNGQPGSCCDRIRCVKKKTGSSCLVEGKMYKDGETMDTKDSCTTCKCLNGIHACSKLDCEPPDCERTYTPVGECCPRCKIIFPDTPKPIRPIRLCKDNLEIYRFPGEVWKSDDCTTCVCGDQGKRCTASSCQRRCENPRKVEGQCCGVCDEATTFEFPEVVCPSMNGCHLTGKECPFGLKINDYGCKLCECEEKSEVCESMDSCGLKCSGGFVKNEIGCEICRCKKGCHDTEPCEKQCPFGLRMKNGCPRCRCRRCADVTGCDKKCRYGRMVNEYGCKICKCRTAADRNPEPIRTKSCVDEEITRDDGEGWMTSSGRSCICRSGRILCDMLSCPVPHCEHPKVEKGSPCAVCPAASHGIMPIVPDEMKCENRVDGEAWVADACTKCACVNGKVKCTFEECKPAPCAKPIYQKDHCCPTCPGKKSALTLEFESKCLDQNGQSRDSGSSWRVDKCTSCACEDGKISCFGETCPRVHACSNPVVKRDQCCPQCLDDSSVNVCRVGHRNYTHGEMWMTSPTGCETCSCVRGNIVCRREVCRPLPDNCPRVFRPEGACCDECTEVVTTLVTSQLTDDEPTMIACSENSCHSSDSLFLVLGIVGGLLLLAFVMAAGYFAYKRQKIPYWQGRKVKCVKA